MLEMKARYTSAWSVRTPPSLTRGNTLTTWKSATQLGSSKLSKRGQATTKTNSNTSFTFLGYGHNSLDCSFICNSGKPGFFVRFEEKMISPKKSNNRFIPLETQFFGRFALVIHFQVWCKNFYYVTKFIGFIKEKIYLFYQKSGLFFWIRKIIFQNGGFG